MYRYSQKAFVMHPVMKSLVIAACKLKSNRIVRISLPEKTRELRLHWARLWAYASAVYSPVCAGVSTEGGWSREGWHDYSSWMGVGIFLRTNWKDIGVSVRGMATIDGSRVPCCMFCWEDCVWVVYLHVWSNFSEADAGAWVKQRNSTVSTTSIWLLLFSRSVMSDSL